MEKDSKYKKTKKLSYIYPIKKTSAVDKLYGLPSLENTILELIILQEKLHDL